MYTYVIYIYMYILHIYKCIHIYIYIYYIFIYIVNKTFLYADIKSRFIHSKNFITFLILLSI